MEIPKNIADRLKRPVAIFGAGVSGSATKQLLARMHAQAKVYDERGGEGAIAAFDDNTATRHDLVIYSPGFAQNHPWLLAARRMGVLCFGEMDFASIFWKGPIVAVTGTNGKTTLTEFLAFAHKRNGREAVAAGNNGYAFSRLFELSGNRVPLPVCEVSSFQSEDIRHFSPTALLWTNFDEDHLDRHPGLEVYFRAKYKLVERLAGEHLFVGESVLAAARRFGLVLPPFTVVATRAEVADKVPQGSIFTSWPQMENYALALRYWLSEGLPVRALEDAARVFTAGRHRLAKVAEINGVSYWNDSKGTNFHAVLAALKTLPGPVLWLGGGQWKGGDLSVFAARLAERVKTAFLIGETAPVLHKVFQEKKVPAHIFKSMHDAVLAAHKAALPGDAVLLSPGFSSFDMFKNYADRGVVFEQLVLALKNSVQ
ncbi:MAG: UDP-N-acetylmuramoyl-L-alanine--D-glutamate ligase [Puniceicoccales bacterium]|jgi:UDP-N-acetylmuramoylalanine--D-glutamate ligase|nr:UDP-N-acetylmuramoyl-L-alanine--D-glutamate ligase [Puniceicoccales bacterium]